jgi:superfamily II DNA or RNA helicase
MRQWRQAFFQNEFGFGIVDESHHSKARTYEPTLNYFHFLHLLGATATPDRHDTLDIRDIFGPECYKLTLEEALARRLLAAVDYHILTDEIVEGGLVQDVEGNFYNLKDFNQSVFVPRRDEEIVRIAKEYAQKIKNPKTIGFCKSKEHAAVMAELFGDAAAYHSGLPRGEQRRILERFRNGELKAIFTISKFDEGVDIPEANQLLFLRATDSKRIYLQQFGRGLRKTKTKKRVQVLDFVNNAERLLLVDRIWRDAATIAQGEAPENEEVWEIDVNNVTFNESSRSALRILRAISANVYRPDQAVPEGSKLATHLARDLNMTKPALISVAASLRIEPQMFPTQRGSEVPYFLADDVQRIISECIRKFGKL